MKGISVWQPWASAIATGAKTIETRSWPASFQEIIAIHAAKRCVRSELLWMLDDQVWQDALAPLKGWGRDNCPDTRAPVSIWDLPFGAIVAVASLAGSLRTERLRQSIYWSERHFGDYSPGRFAWILANVRPLREPIPFKGRQGFFHVPDDLILRQGHQLALPLATDHGPLTQEAGGEL